MKDLLLIERQLKLVFDQPIVEAIVYEDNVFSVQEFKNVIFNNTMGEPLRVKERILSDVIVLRSSIKGLVVYKEFDTFVRISLYRIVNGKVVRYNTKVSISQFKGV